MFLLTKMNVALCHQFNNFVQFLSLIYLTFRVVLSLLRQLDELESSLPVERKNVESLQRSMHFLTQKKKDYQKQIVELVRLQY